MKHLPNIITIIRIPLSIAMLFVIPFSVFFWIFYLSCGLTDMIDGFLARKLHQESEFGAKLDSISDVIFAVGITVFVAINIEISQWLGGIVLVIAMIRFASYGIGFFKYHEFTALHTLANKLAGIVLFATPILYWLSGLVLTGIIVCIVAMASACEELIIIIKSKELNRNCKGILCGKF